MTNKENNHYVPQFYLKLFSNNNKSIGMYLLDINKFIVNASIKDNFYRKFLYGEDGKIEDEFMIIEGEFARVIKQILNDGFLPTDQDDFIILLFFVLLTHARTTMQADAFLQQTTEMYRAIMRSDPRMKSDKAIDKFELTADIPNLFNIKFATKYLPILFDLCPILIINDSNRSFITSDNPVALYNAYLYKRNCKNGIGFAHAGLTYFLPLSPFICLCLFDSEVYEIDVEKYHHNENRIWISSGSEIDEINKMLACNSYKSLVFNNLEKEHFIRKYAKYAAKRIYLPKVEMFDLSKKASIIRIPGYEMSDYFKLDFLTIKKEAQNNATPYGVPICRPRAEKIIREIEMDNESEYST